MQRNRNLIKTVKTYQCHWKNIPLLLKMLNPAGKLLNRHQTRFPSRIHRKLSKKVKHARTLGLLPYSDFIKETDKIPLTSNHQMFYEETVQVIDPSTGMVKTVNNQTEQEKFTYANYDSATMAKQEMFRSIEDQKFRDSLMLDPRGIPFHPDQDQREMLMAQNYILRNERKDKEMEKPIYPVKDELKQTKKRFTEAGEEIVLEDEEDLEDFEFSGFEEMAKISSDSTELKLQEQSQSELSVLDKKTKEISQIYSEEMKNQEKESYEKMRQLIKDKVNIASIFEAFIFEKSYSVKEVSRFILLTSQIKDIEKIEVSDASKKENYNQEIQKSILDINKLIESSDVLNNTHSQYNEKIQHRQAPKLNVRDHSPKYKFKREIKVKT